ncbi:MAG: hypothetical protein U1F77_03975 [Kiritimatiellia bacterium]
MGNTFTNPDGATETIARPTLLIHRARVELNIAAMAAKAAASGVRFRPHFKTHQSIEVGRWFRAAGVEAITVSSPDMAVEFAADGWDDILIAVPLNPGAVDIYRDLSERIALGLLVDHPDHLVLRRRPASARTSGSRSMPDTAKAWAAWDDADSPARPGPGHHRPAPCALCRIIGPPRSDLPVPRRARSKTNWNQCAARLWTANESAGRLPAFPSAMTPACSVLDRRRLHRGPARDLRALRFAAT